MQVALDEYMRLARFHCSYTLRQGGADSAERALAGALTADTTATGHITWSGDKIRFSIKYDGPPKLLSEGNKTKTTSQPSIDEMTNGSVQIAYTPLQGEFGNTVTLGRPEGLRSVHLSAASLCMHPLALFGGDVMNPLANPCPDCADSTFARHMANDQGEYITLETVLRSSEGETRRTINIDATADPPIVVSMHITSTPTGFADVVASEHVKVGGVQVPTRIRLAMGTARDAQCIGREWKAKDLRLPNDRDYVMQLPADVRFSGLKNPPKVRGPSVLDLTKLTPDMVDDGSELRELLESHPNVVARRPWLWIGVSAGVGVLVVTFLFFYWVRR
jgi:hypothetical protein